MTVTEAPSSETVMVGSLVESNQHVEMPGIVTKTRARAVRAPCWTIVLAVQLVAGHDLLTRIVDIVV